MLVDGEHDCECRSLLRRYNFLHCVKNLQELTNVVEDRELNIGKEKIFELFDIFGLLNEFPDSLEVMVRSRSYINGVRAYRV